MASSQYAGKHALIIEDNALNAEILAILLKAHGVTFTVMSTPASLEKRLRKLEQVDVVFLDLELKHHDGFDVYHRIRQSPRGQEVRVIAYTVHISEIDRARREGFDGFLGKPLDQAVFSDQIRRIFNAEPVWDV